MTADPIAPSLLVGGAMTPTTTFLLIHHGLRRDLQRIRQLLAADQPLPDLAALRAHWDLVQRILHAHHTAEDTVLFPGLRAMHPAVAVHIDALDAEHGLLDGLLDAVDAAIAAPHLDADRTASRASMDALVGMLQAHLTSEEVHLVPLMAQVPSGAGPTAGGPGRGGGIEPSTAIAWSLDGVHPDIVATLMADMPAELAAQVPAWLADWDQRRTATFGAALRVGATTTAVPEGDGITDPAAAG